MINLEALQLIVYGQLGSAVVAPGVHVTRLPNGRLLLQGHTWRSLVTREEASVTGLLRIVRKRLTAG
ncbi:MAG: hypothetical protein AAFX65_07410 [Cyanobacteria bacterium J06638_7]